MFLDQPDKGRCAIGPRRPTSSYWISSGKHRLLAGREPRCLCPAKKAPTSKLRRAAPPPPSFRAKREISLPPIWPTKRRDRREIPRRLRVRGMAGRGKAPPTPRPPVTSHKPPFFRAPPVAPRAHERSPR